MISLGHKTLDMGKLKREDVIDLTWLDFIYSINSVNVELFRLL